MPDARRRPMHGAVMRHSGQTMENPAYEKWVEYHFEVVGEKIAITGFGDEWVCVEELRKNGQEDTHMEGVLSLVDGKFEWEDGEEMFAQYHSQKLADGIKDYLNANGLPENVPAI